MVCSDLVEIVSSSSLIKSISDAKNKEFEFIAPLSNPSRF